MQRFIVDLIYQHPQTGALSERSFAIQARDQRDAVEAAIRRACALPDYAMLAGGACSPVAAEPELRRARA